MDDFALDGSELAHLHSLFRILVLGDIALTSNRNDADKKRSWLAAWVAQTETSTGEQTSGTGDVDAIVHRCSEFFRHTSDSKRHILLVELVDFSPYAGIDGCSWIGPEEEIGKALSALGVDINLFVHYKNRLDRAHSGIRGQLVTSLLKDVGMLAVWPKVGAQRLATRIAKLSDSAWDFEGSGGYVMTLRGKDTAIYLVGGGGLLIVPDLPQRPELIISAPSEAVLSYATKLEVVFAEIVLGRRRDMAGATTIIERERRTLCCLQDERDRILLSGGTQADVKEHVKTIENSIGFVARSIARNRDAIMRASEDGG